MKTISAILAVGLVVGACDKIAPIDMPKSEDKKDADQTSPAGKLADAQVNAFNTLADKAQTALDAEQTVQARQFIDRGLAQTQKAGRDYDLYEARFSLLKGKLAQMEGNTIDARRFFGDAMAVYRIHKNSPGTFEVRLAQAALEEGGGDFAAAQRELDEADKLLSSVTDATLKGEFTYRQASLYASQLKEQDAAKLFLQVAEHFHSVKNLKREADAFVALADCEEGLEKPHEAKNSLNKAYKIYTELNNKEGAVKALHRLAQFSLREEKYKTAKEQLKKVEALYQELGHQSAATKVSQHIAALPE